MLIYKSHVVHLSAGEIFHVMLDCESTSQEIFVSTSIIYFSIMFTVRGSGFSSAVRQTDTTYDICSDYHMFSCVILRILKKVL